MMKAQPALARVKITAGLCKNFRGLSDGFRVGAYRPFSVILMPVFGLRVTDGQGVIV
jgi:hypothetical protein